MAKKNVRNMKVCGQSGYKYETVPAITLKGRTGISSWGLCTGEM